MIPHPQVFMAYASEDEDVSDFFRKQLETAFANRLSIFVASGNDGITPGRVWFDELTLKLREAKLVLAMVSRSSLRTAWIPFECGTAFGAGKTFIPLCHSGIRVIDLPQPLANFQALDLAKDGHLRRLLVSLKAVGALPDPNIDTVALAKYFEETDRVAAAWQNFNELIVPIYWSNRSAFEKLFRSGTARLVVAEQYLDRLQLVSGFCQLQGIMTMRLGTADNGNHLVEFATGDKFHLLLSRKCAIAGDLSRQLKAA